LGRLVGAPENLQQYLEGFKKEDIEANPEAVLMAADRARQMAEEEFSSELKSAAHFSQEDPSKYYEIVKKIGYGGFARVFLVKRKDDGKQYALKFIEPKNAKER
jgi:serine/threonine protein kinase